MRLFLLSSVAIPLFLMLTGCGEADPVLTAPAAVVTTHAAQQSLPSVRKTT